jgi:hypothetical protein
MLEGQNSVLNQLVYDIIQGRYGGPSRTSLADNLSVFICIHGRAGPLVQSVGDHVNQDQPQASDSMLPPSQLPMDLRKEERTSRSNKRVLSEINVSEWEITYKETRHVRANEVATLARPLSSPQAKLTRKPGC